LTSETADTQSSEQVGVAQARPPAQTGDAAPAPEASQTPQGAPQQAGGRRTQLKVVRESIESLSRDVWSFRKSHEASTKDLQKQVTTLRKDLAAHARSMDPAKLTKSGEASTKRLEKQVASLGKDLAALRASIAKDAARDRAKQQAALAKILAKLGAKTRAPKRTSKRK
jgi:hypothetical protein